jgi:lipoate-protein ligase B
MKKLIVWTPGEIEYGTAWHWQKKIHALRREEKLSDTLILLEHPHVYTIGRHGDRRNILFDEKTLREKRVSVYPVDRGGDVTYHGPGQLVGYPIFNYRQLGFSTRLFVRAVEDLILQYLTDLGFKPCLDPQYPGVWIGQNKICAIGLRVVNDISMHGFALNINPDLSLFSGIIACGIQDRGVTSFEKENIKIPDNETVYSRISELFIQKFGFDACQRFSDSSVDPFMS